jgi:hypothetical protein
MKLLLGVVLLGSSIALWARFFYFTDPFQFYRLRIWKHSLQGILQDPYMGIGLNMLPYRASQFNFPADVEVGRYARMATTADNQYFQILIETGFLGFFLFLIGWIGLYFAMRRLDNRFLAFRSSFFAITVVSFFMLPFDSTAILFLFLFLAIFPVTFDSERNPLPLTLRLPLRIGVILTLVIFGFFAVFIPYKSDLQFRLSLRTPDLAQSDAHLKKAMTLNPYQPYYGFSRVKRIVDARPNIGPERYSSLVSYLKELEKLNPLEPDFLVYQAKILRILLDETGEQPFYPEAVSAYSSAIDLNPYNVFLRAEYAFFEWRRGNLRRANSELNSILNLEPAYLNARLLLAQVLWRQGDVAQAKYQYQEVQRLASKYREPAYSVNESYVRKLLQVDSKYKEEVYRQIFS